MVSWWIVLGYSLVVSAHFPLQDFQRQCPVQFQLALLVEQNAHRTTAVMLQQEDH